jgi:uncharacterized membrane-anchored protein
MTVLKTPELQTPGPGAGLPEHPDRRLVSDEVHARPYPLMQAPEQASHLAVLSGEGMPGDDHACLVRLCRLIGREPPPPDASHYAVEFDGTAAGPVRLRWERHTEFATYTFFRPLAGGDPFAEPAIRAVPPAWIESLPPTVMVAVHAALLAGPAGAAPEQVVACAELGRHFASENVAGSLVSGGTAAAWTDFVLREDGFSRILVLDLGLRERQAGRLVQRLLEIETYRIMALLALPVTRRLTPHMARLDQTLTETTGGMAGLTDIEDERALLDTLMGHAAEIERLVNASAYRFGAARAYHALVDRRVEELRETRIEGLQTIREFLDRRLAPAMRTCRSAAERLEALAQRVARASNLLRTRVDIQLEAQNRDVLVSMNRRARLQLRLQETVEGLSVVAISYYAVGLTGYAATAAHAAGLPVDHDLAVGIAIPVVVAAVWFMVRRIRRRLVYRGGDGADAGD